MRQTRDIIATLLSNIGSRKEVQQYLKRFASVDSTQFAVVKVGGGIITDHLDSLSSALSFLHKVGLYPIVIHGAGPQLNEALAEIGIETEKIDGLRVTSPEVLDVARRVFQRENLKLVEALEDIGARARPILTGVFEARAFDPGRLGLVGEVTKVNLDAIESSIRSGSLPILASLGEAPGGQILNINADVATRELALAIEPYKIIFLTATGGLLDEHGRIISAINLAEDYDDLTKQPWVDGGMRLKLDEIKRLLDELPHSSSVSITSPGHLAKELFTHRGSGTLVRRGERIARHDSMNDIDTEAIRNLVELCFMRRLTPDYFETQRFYRIYLADSYRATAILTQENGDIPYLDKFAVTTEAQGAGLGGSVWLRMSKENPKLYWRSRTTNPVNTWYFEHSAGSYRHGEWTVFWYGLDGFDEIRSCIDHALALPATLADPIPAEAKG
ncbi:MAG: acetylglutamate kinase [Phycisphaerales bacterium]